MKLVALGVTLSLAVGCYVPARSEDLPAARPRSLDECEALFAARPADKETALCFYDLAKGEGPREVIEEADRRLAHLAAKHPELPWFPYYLANRRYSDPEIAEALYGRAAGAFRVSGEIHGEAYARRSRSRLLVSLDRLEEARAEKERFLALAEGSDDQELRRWVQIERAQEFLRSGDLGGAYARLKELETSVWREEPHSQRSHRLVQLGYTCLQIGRLGEARKAFENVVEIALATRNPYLEANAWYNLAAISFEELSELPTSNNLQAALESAARALEATTRAGHRSAEVKAAWILATIASEAERPGYLERCFAAGRTENLQSYCFAALASEQVRGDPVAATESALRALDLAEEAEDIWSKIFARRAMKRVQWEISSPESALETSWKALDILETLRDLQTQGSEIQAGTFSVWSDDYAFVVGRLFESAGANADPEWATAEAFRVGERMRARALTDWLQRAGSVDAGPASDFASVEEVQAALGLGEMMLSFQVAPWEGPAGEFGGGSWLLAVTSDGVRIHRLPGRVEIRRDVWIVDGQIHSRQGAEADLTARLFDKLLASALAELPPQVNRLILVPDDALHRVPFAALRASPDGEPLGSRFELVQVPSATLWLDWRRAQVAAPVRPLLVLADPDLPAAEGASGDDRVKIAQVRDAAEALGRLPHARREGRAAARALGGGLLLVGAEASEAGLRSLPLRDFGLIHFAAHAVNDEYLPERSAVLLAPGGGHDGLLQSAEIAGLDLAGRTVVLASCRSASGTVLRGEGVMSLARAFFQSGAHAVVASLWPLRDDESAVMFGRFYRHLGRGSTVSEALHRARREAIEAGEPAAAWAGLVVLGDGSVVPLPRGRRAGVGRGVLWGSVAAALMIVAAAGLMLTRRAHARRSSRV